MRAGCGTADEQEGSERQQREGMKEPARRAGVLAANRFHGDTG
jgi:hypothetical protein